ncbi:ABC transporter permease [Paenibacillus apiarius]|uniref:ABC transporter permease n=1 Tax=Paenibacillus apiarius TaxID=46240 RepID=A0ABT4DUZ3_9BACL|nr:ABC transporter permease [Paenibacillus apiarius]MCY9516386.1 ABC transporter permease [Paenibacillus apiarius]MCY9521154.1 ABC transporter permease [Paenibacillus apiarius]MCY9552001.1 ABC transporter permease [Paenibacillus apiarius]MCY9560946.1 ABC transporter permease [Paenibacillus apiarius]MCY9684575.1 ABC transporter permease [Paenibacillus apiarius]
MRRSKHTVTYLYVLIFVLLLNFVLPRLLPGGPIDFLEGGEDGPVFISDAQKAAMRDYYHLDESAWMQLADYVKGIFTFDFGQSFTYKMPVYEVIMNRLPWTLLIVGVATVLSIVIGIAAGLLSAWRHAGNHDRGWFLTMISVSTIPDFLTGMLFVLGFSVKWDWFPLGGAETPFYTPNGWWDLVIDVSWHAALPVVTLTVANTASIYLLMRNEAIRVLREPFIEFALAKGVGSGTILYRHVLRNAILPIITMVVVRLGGLLAGSVLVETVFSYPGIGNLLQEAILARDYPLLHGLFVLMTVFVLLLNMAADRIYPLLDPRIQTGKQGGA